MKPKQRSGLLESELAYSFIPGTNRLTGASVNFLLEQVRRNDEILKRLLQTDLNNQVARQKK